MKNKTKIIIAVISVLLVAALVVGLVFVFISKSNTDPVGTSSGPESTEASSNQNESESGSTPEESVPGESGEESSEAGQSAEESSETSDIEDSSGDESSDEVSSEVSDPDNESSDTEDSSDPDDESSEPEEFVSVEVSTGGEESCDHEFGDWKTVKEPTCTEEGLDEHKCAKCGMTVTKTTQKLGHSFSEWKVTKTATCDTEGEKTRTCSRCGKTETKSISKTDHKYGAWTTTKNATCKAEGEQKRTCSVCGKTETKSISKTDHSYGDWVVTTPATSTSDGVKTKTCSVCGKTKTEKIPKTGGSTSTCNHKQLDPSDGTYWNMLEIDYNLSTPPTCQKDGQYVERCKLCGELVYETWSNSGIDHAYKVTNFKDSTSSATGSITFTCEVCGDKITKTIPKKGNSESCKDAYGQYEHDREDFGFIKVLDSVDCGGVHAYKLSYCSVCGERFEKNVLLNCPALSKTAGEHKLEVVGHHEKELYENASNREQYTFVTYDECVCSVCGKQFTKLYSDSANKYSDGSAYKTRSQYSANIYEFMTYDGYSIKWSTKKWSSWKTIREGSSDTGKIEERYCEQTNQYERRYTSIDGSWSDVVAVEGNTSSERSSEVLFRIYNYTYLRTDPLYTIDRVEIRIFDNRGQISTAMVPSIKIINETDSPAIIIWKDNNGNVFQVKINVYHKTDHASVYGGIVLTVNEDNSYNIVGIPCYADWK